MEPLLCVGHCVGKVWVERREINGDTTHASCTHLAHSTLVSPSHLFYPQIFPERWKVERNVISHLNSLSFLLRGISLTCAF